MIDSFYYFHKAESVPTVSMVQKYEVHSTEESATVQSSERFYEPSDHTRIPQISSIDAKQEVGNLLQGSPSDTSSLTSWLREYMLKFGLSLRSQSHLPLIIVIIVAVIFIMQVFTLWPDYLYHIGICSCIQMMSYREYIFPQNFCCGLSLGLCCLVFTIVLILTFFKSIRRNLHFQLGKEQSICFGIVLLRVYFRRRVDGCNLRGYLKCVLFSLIVVEHTRTTSQAPTHPCALACGLYKWLGQWCRWKIIWSYYLAGEASSQP